MMNMYEVILNIIDQKGPTSIPSICQEVNEHPVYMQERERPVQQSQIKSVISRKSDLFSVDNDVVSLLPNKELIELTVHVGACRGPWMKIEVDFIQKNFTYFEWNLEPVRPLKSGVYNTVKAGSTDEFKQEVYRLKIWDWDANYEQEGIVLDGINWSIRLETKAEVYKSEGFQRFPTGWLKFCRALSILTGKKIN